MKSMTGRRKGQRRVVLRKDGTGCERTQTELNVSGGKTKTQVISVAEEGRGGTRPTTRQGLSSHKREVPQITTSTGT